MMYRSEMLISIMVRNKIHAIKLTTQENTIKLKIYANDFSYFCVCGFGLGFSKIFCAHAVFYDNRNKPVGKEWTSEFRIPWDETVW